MKTQKAIIKIIEKILKNDFSDALKMQVKHAKTCCENIHTPTDFEVFNYQFWSLVDICEYYLKTL